MRKAKKTVRDILRNQSDAELLWNLDEKAPDVQAIICLELGRRKVTDAVPHLRARLGSTSAAIREATAEALAEIGDQSIAEDLLRLLLDRDQPEGVRDTCAFALAKLRYAPAIAELASALADPSPSVRICVAAALAAIQNPEVRDQVESALSVELDPAVRDALMKLLVSLPARRKERLFEERTPNEQNLIGVKPLKVELGELLRGQLVHLPWEPNSRQEIQKIPSPVDGQEKFQPYVSPAQPSNESQEPLAA